MSELSLPQPGPAISDADIEAIRACGRPTRNLGYVSCLIGVLTMIAGRYMQNSPTWLASVGLGVVIFGWGLLAYALVKRTTLARKLLSRRGA